MERTSNKDRALLAAYALMVLVEIIGLFALGVALAHSSLLIWATGVIIIVAAFGLDEYIKAVYRRSTPMLDAYVATLEKRPLPGMLYHLARAIIHWRRLQRS